MTTETAEIDYADKFKVISVNVFGSTVEISRMVGTTELWGRKRTSQVYREYYNVSRYSLARLAKVITRMSSGGKADIYLGWSGYEADIWR